MAKHARTAGKNVIRLRTSAGRQEAQRSRIVPPIVPRLAPALAHEIQSACSPPSTAPQPPAEAVGLFQTGMEALQRHEFSVAATGFQTLLRRFPAERALVDRARLYLELAEREQRREPAPTTAEERLTAATAALNVGDDSRAESFVRDVLSEEPVNDLALYLSAAIDARRGRSEEALEWLRQAISVSPDVAAQAALDPDFEPLHDSVGFQHLTRTTAPRRIRRIRR